MAEEGATFYYVSKQHFDFQKSYSYLEKAGLSLRHTDSNFNIIIKERMCEIFTNLAIEIIAEISTQFLGFTLDMYGETEAYDFEKIFDNNKTNRQNNTKRDKS